MPAQNLTRPDGHSIVYDRANGAAPTVVFLHGLASDRGGTKAVALDAHCRRQGLSCLRYDMFGHGQSTGRFEDGGPTRWAEDAVAVIDQLTAGPLIVVGSSMGGWVALKVAEARPARIQGLIGIAPAPDFTERLMWAGFTDDQRRAISDRGVIELPPAYGEAPLRISRHLIEDGRANLMLNRTIDIKCPVRLLQGQRDDSVPWRTALEIAEHIAGDDVVVTLIKDGDHRLSRQQDLDLLTTTVDLLVAQCRR